MFPFHPTLVPASSPKRSSTLHFFLFSCLISTSVLAQDVSWLYPTSDLVINYNDVIVPAWTSSYEYPGLILWGPNADGTATVEWYHYSSAWTNGTYAYSFSSALDGPDTYPLSAHFQLMSNTTTISDGVNGDSFSVTSTSGLPKTYAFSTTITQTAATSAVPTPTNSAGIVSNASPYTYVGCWTDDPQDRTLVNQFDVARENGGSNNMTVDNCISLCYGDQSVLIQRYPIMGVEDGNQCFCDFSIYNPSSYLASESDCDIPCAGNSAQNCGGVNRLNLYAINRTVPAWSASIAASITSPAPTAGATGTSGVSTTASAFVAGSTASTSSSSSSTSGLSAGAQAGIGVGAGLGGALLLAGIGFFFWRRRRSQQKSRNEYYPPPAYEAGGFTEPSTEISQPDMRQHPELATHGQAGVHELSATEREPVELPPHRKT